MRIVDYFAFAGIYPFGAPGKFRIEDLLSEMDADGIDHAYVTDIGSIYRKEPTEANRAFLRTCASRADRIGALAVIDLSVNTFDKDIRDLHDEFGLKGVRIQPNHHGYTLNSGRCEALFDVLSDLKLMLFAAREIEDTRLQPTCLGVRALRVEDLQGLLTRAAKVPIILNGFPAGEIDTAGTELPGNVFFDVAAFDGSFYAMERLIEKHGPGRFVFGSHVPFFYAGAVLEGLRKSFLDGEGVSQILAGLRC